MCTSDRAWWNMEKKCARKRFCTAKCIHDSHRIINDRMEKYSSLFVFISKQHCRTALKNLRADGRGGWVADGSLCRSRVAAKFLFCQNFEKHKIWQNNFEFCEIWGKFRGTQNWKFCENFSKLRKQKVSQPLYVGVEWGGGVPVQPWRTLRASADCALFVFLLYCFPFCHL